MVIKGGVVGGAVSNPLPHDLENALVKYSNSFAKKIVFRLHKWRFSSILSLFFSPSLRTYYLLNPSPGVAPIVF